MSNLSPRERRSLERRRRRGYPSEGRGLIVGITLLVLVVGALTVLAVLRGWT